MIVGINRLIPTNSKNGCEMAIDLTIIFKVAAK
jgi:hypothetical protein